MKNRDEIVERVSRPYVGNDCVQVSEGYNDSLTIFSRDGIIYHDVIDYPCISINRYMEDDRRNSFAYANIPTYISKNGLFEVKHTIQLFDYDKVYVMIKDGNVYEKYIVRDGNSALVLTKFVNSNDRVLMLSREELDNLFNNNSYLMNLDGGFYKDLCIPKEEDIVSLLKDKYRRELEEYRDSNDDTISEDMLGLLDNSINSISIDNIPADTYLTDDDIVMVKIDKDNIIVSVYTIMFMGRDKYMVKVYDYLMDKYSLSLESLKDMPIVKVRMPKILYNLNLNIPKEEVIKQNRLVRRRKR